MASPAGLRNGVQTVAYWAARELIAVWPTNITDTAELRALLHDVLPTLNVTYGEAAAALAAEWYEQDRDDHGVGSYFAPTPVEVGVARGTGGTEALANWAAKIADRPDVDLLALRELVIGGLTRRIGNAARGTVAANSIIDRRAEGWYRYTAADGCGFCRTLAGRGAVYTEQSVLFGAHDHCGCMAAPEWSNVDREKQVNAYIPSTRNISDADKARAKAWMKANLT